VAHRTHVAAHTADPQWNEAVLFDGESLEHGGRVVTFEVWDQSIFADELVGGVWVLRGWREGGSALQGPRARRGRRGKRAARGGGKLLQCAHPCTPVVTASPLGPKPARPQIAKAYLDLDLLEGSEDEAESEAGGDAGSSTPAGAPPAGSPPSASGSAPRRASRRASGGGALAAGAERSEVLTLLPGSSKPLPAPTSAAARKRKPTLSRSTHLTVRSAGTVRRSARVMSLGDLEVAVSWITEPAFGPEGGCCLGGGEVVRA
jgi:hypothetical protein